MTEERSCEKIKVLTGSDDAQKKKKNIITTQRELVVVIENINSWRVGRPG